MRNLKRALSLVVASVMLLGMMVVGTSAASFSDADEIVNKEAVEITAGLGLFAGSDGKFNPKGNVTRAQMATIIVKMLYGSEINADQFKGTNKFSDTAAFEGGWAEGYINLCSNLGVVKGYGDGTFKPGQGLTTAEAVTMIINALKVDAGEGTWPLTVMAKAEEMKLFAELAVKPGTNEALTRDALASIVLEGLEYSPKGTSGYKINGVPTTFETYADALTTVLLSQGAYDVTDIAEVVGEDTLAKTVFNMTSVSGFVTANQATGFDYTEVAGVALNLETGLDMIGHYVTAYYAEEFESEEDPGVAYAIVDEAKYVVVSGDEAVNTKKEYQSFFGTKALPLADAMQYVDGTYNVVTFPYTVDENEPATPDNTEDDTTYTFGSVCAYDKDNWTAPNGTYVIYEGEVIGFIAGATKTLAKVTYVSSIAGKEYIRIGVTTMQNNADEDVVNEYQGIAKDDIVVVESANGIYTLTKAEKVEGKITRTAVVDGTNVITVNGTQYKEFEATNNTGLAHEPKKPDGSSNINFETTYAVYVADGKYIGWDGISAAANVSDVIYVVGTYPLDGAQDAYGNVTNNIYAQGVDMNGKEVSVLIGSQKVGQELLGVGTLTDGFYTFKLAATGDEKKANIMVATPVTAAGADGYEDGIYTLNLRDTDNNNLSADSAYVDFAIGEESDIAFLAPTTKFIVVDGNTVGGELDIAMVTGLYKTDVANCPAILSQDATGNSTLEVVVIDGTVSITSDDYIYVSADQKDTSSVTADGTEYTVYFTGTNENKAIIVDEAIANVGFYTYVIEKDENGVDVYTLTLAEGEEANAANVIEGELFTRLNGTKLISTNVTAKDAAAAKIIDVRGAETIKESDVSEMTMLADLTAAKDAGFNVTFSVVLDEELETVTHIFITGVEFVGE